MEKRKILRVRFRKTLNPHHLFSCSCSLANGRPTGCTAELLNTRNPLNEKQAAGGASMRCMNG